MFNEGLMDSAMIIGAKAQAEAERTPNGELLKAKSHFIQAMSASRIGKHETTELHLENGFSILGEEDIQSSTEEALVRLRLHSTAGLYYQQIGHFTNALDNYLKAESIIKRYHLPPNHTLASISNNIALIYLDQEDFEQALEYFQKAQTRAVEMNLSDGRRALIEG
ncbi:MAG: tetratricopeptide repeat protein, partial [Bacteroidota bacterium]